MNILLTTLNAKYVHTSLGLWSIYQTCRSGHPGLRFREFNINQDLDWICGEIYLERARVVAFSCNIWNIEPIRSLGRRLKALAPETVFVLGGPEVWTDPGAWLEREPWADFIVIGEGELTFKEWLDRFGSAEPRWEEVRGLAYRRGPSGPVVNESRPALADLNQLPFPYPEDLEPFQKKLVYYESSRGCPNHCQYCLSANERGVRYLDLDRVKRELLKFVEAGIAQVKFVDRTFNSHPGRAKEIWRFLIEHPGRTNFHFEIMGDLLDEESLAILKEAPAGLFQFEIGVQSTNPETLRLIRRKMDFGKLAERVTRLVRESRVFVHLDLIAGLPAEDYQSFIRTFNDNLALRPTRLQLGFLKLLHGSGLRGQAAEYGYIFTSEAPYEVLASRWIRYDQLLRLKLIEDLLERYYNSGRFRLSFQYLLGSHADSFMLFDRLAGWWKGKGFDQIAHKGRDLYRYLLEFWEAERGPAPEFREVLKYDLLVSERMVEPPEWAGGNSSELQRAGYRFWQDPEHRHSYLRDWPELSIREIQRRVLFTGFDADPLRLAENPGAAADCGPQIYLFVYGQNDVSVYPLTEEELL